MVTSYATTTEAFVRCHQDITSSGAVLTQMEYHLTDAYNFMNAEFKTAWTSNNTLGSTIPAVKVVCLNIVSRLFAKGEQLRIAAGGTGASMGGMSFNFPGGNPLYITKDEHRMILGSTTYGGKVNAVYVGGAYVST